MVASPWAVLLCKFSDDDSEPFSRDYYEDLFTSSGIGSRNMVDFFRDVSHDSIDISTSQIFGWYTLNMQRSAYAGLAGRGDLLSRARQAAMVNGDDISPFVSVVVCMNVQTDLFGGPSGVVCDNLSADPRFMGQEMGHFYGLDHSRADTVVPCGDDSTPDYKDFWDVMSTQGCAFSASHPRYGWIGPGLNAANMASRGWLDESRVWKTSSRSFDTVVLIRPLHRRDLPGLLAARIGQYLVEFRSKEGWDAAIPRSAVLVHRFDDNHSYIMSANDGDQDLVLGSTFGTLDTGSAALSVFTGVTKVEVVEINTDEQFAKIRLVHYPPFEEPSLNGILFGGADKGAGGHIFVPGRGFVPIPPHSPFVRVLQQIAAYEEGEMITSVHLRNTVRREALAAIASFLEEQMQSLQEFRQPAPPQRRPEQYRS